METSEETQKGKFLAFSVGKEAYGIEIKFVTDIIGIQDITETCVGLIVDNVAEVITIDDENIVPPPDIKTGFHNSYVRGIGKVGNEVKLLIDCDKLLNDDELENLNTII